MILCNDTAALDKFGVKCLIGREQKWKKEKADGENEHDTKFYLIGYLEQSTSAQMTHVEKRKF